MLYLAQVEKKGFLGKIGLRLLARQRTEDTWAAVAGEEAILSAESPQSLGEGALVLVEVSPSGEIVKIQDATSWVVGLVRDYLIKGITPAFLQQEAERVEQWRQSLTLQSQELARRTLELEARREQLQELEEELRREKKKLELLAAQLPVKTDGAQFRDEPQPQPRAWGGSY
jgi:hypothetical protein